MSEALGAEVGFAEAVPGVVAEGVGLGGVGEDAAVELAVAVGVLPYPITFLCTDLISELYGRARANFLVTVGLGLNIFIVYASLLFPLFNWVIAPPKSRRRILFFKLSIQTSVFRMFI